MNTNFSSINIDLIPCSEELHVVPSTGTGGRGIASDPLMIPGGDLDATVFKGHPALYGVSLKIVFGEGRFFLSHFKTPTTACVPIGSGVGKTILQLKDNVNSKAKNPYWPHIRMISDGAWCLNFGMRDMTFDCNWRGQQEAATNGNFKIEALVINSVRGKLERVDVIDAGCHASKEIYGNVGLESFPIALQTVSMGPPYDQYLPDYKNRGEEVASFLEISQCRILSATFLGGGYCTGIFVRTNQPGQGDRLPKGARSTLAAWVHDNYVENIKGIAYGCAHSEHVLFERNHAVGNKCGFNCDTGRNENIVLRDNRFLENNHGVNFSPDGGGKGLLMEGNTILAGPRGSNPITGLPEGYAGLSIGNTLETVMKGNTLIGPLDWVATQFSNYPVTSIDDERLIIGSENVTPGTPPPVPTGNEDALIASLRVTIDDVFAEKEALANRNLAVSEQLLAMTLERNAAMDRANAVIAENAKLSDAQKSVELVQKDLKDQLNKKDVELSLLEDAVLDTISAESKLRKMVGHQT